MTDVSSIVSAMDRKGVKLSLENDQLRYRAPKGLLTTQDGEVLRRYKSEIVEFLRKSAALMERPALKPRAASDFVPLARNQKWWRSVLHPQGMAGRIRFSEIRLCAAAIRLIGELDIESIRQAMTALFRRHESLRTEIVTDGENLGMRAQAAGAYDLEIMDLTAMEPAAAECEARSLVDEVIFDLPGPIFLARLLRLASKHHVLVMALEHIVADRTSVMILFRDLAVLYAQASRGEPLALPELPIQYADYVDWQRRLDRWWDAHHGTYWNDRLRGAVASRFQVDEAAPTGARFKFNQIHLRIDEPLAAGLREVARVATTTLPMAFLSAYTALLMRWRRRNDLLIKFVVHGRDQPEFQNLVGFVSDTVHLRIELRKHDSFLDLVKTVTTEYYTALDKYDFSRVGERLFASDSELALSATVNWLTLPHVNESASQVRGPYPWGADESLLMEPFRHTAYWPYIIRKNLDFDSALKPYEPWLAAGEDADGIYGSMTYRLDRYEPASMQRLFNNFRHFVEQFVRQPEILVSKMHYLM